MVRGYEESIRRRVEDSSLVEVGRAVVFDETLKGGVWPKDREEGVMVYEERFWLGGGGRDYGGPL